MASQSNGGAESFPGHDLDPEKRVRSYICLGQSIAGGFFTLGILGAVLAKFGLIKIPDSLTPYECARGIAFLVTVVNIGAWMYFPLADLAIQRRWIRSVYVVLPAGTTEFFMILLALVLLLSTTVTAVISPLALAIAGFGVYLWNFLGYAYLRTQLQRVIRESRKLCGDENEPGRAALLRGLNVVQDYFALAENVHPVNNRQQVRHALLALAFVVSAILAGIGMYTNNDVLLILSYYWSAGVFLSAEVCIAIWRARRDRKLLVIEENWRRACV